MRHPDIFSLTAVDHIAEDPATGCAVGIIRPPSAVEALTALGNTGNSNPVPHLDVPHCRAYLYNLSTKFMTKNSGWLYLRHPTMPDVDISPADS